MSKKLRILIDIGHPAHVHYYRNLAGILEHKGHNVIWTVKEIDVVKRLLDFYGFSYTVFPKKARGIIGKIIRQFQYDWKLLGICKREKIDIAIGSSVTISHISKISGLKSIVFDDDDDDIQPFVTWFSTPFASHIASPDAMKGKRKRKDTLYYPGYHELAYLHPRYFQPDPSVLDETGIKKNEPFFIMRFNAFRAHHDIGVNGLSLAQKLELIDILKPHGKIFITTEENMEQELRSYQLPVSPEKIHSLMAFAGMFLGDSQTMTSEAAVLGTPAVKCNTLAGKLSVPNELEHKYGLCYSFQPVEFHLMKEKVRELLQKPKLKEEWAEKRRIMLSEKIDVTAFWAWMIDSYPQSLETLKKNPEYQSYFR